MNPGAKYGSHVNRGSHIFIRNYCNGRGRRVLRPTQSVFFSLFHRVFHINCTESAEGKGRRIKCIIIFNFDKAPIFLFLFSSLPSHLAGVGRRPRTRRSERRQARHVDPRQQAKVTEGSRVAPSLFHLVFCTATTAAAAFHWTHSKPQSIPGSKNSSPLGAGWKNTELAKVSTFCS